MTMSINPAAGWNQVALFEVDAHEASIEAMTRTALENMQGLVDIVPSVSSPPGYAWFEVLVDFTVGERRALQITRDVLTVLRQAGESLLGFRIVNGTAWIEMAERQMSDDVFHERGSSEHGARC